MVARGGGLVNLAVFLDFHQFVSGLSSEWHHANSGHGELTWSWYSMTYFSRIHDSLTGLGLLCLASLYLFSLSKWNSVSKERKDLATLLLVPSFTYFLVIQMAALKLAARYIHPLVLTIIFCSLLLSSGISHKKSLFRLFYLFVFLLLVAAFSYNAYKIWISINRAPHVSVSKWIKGNCEPGACKIIADSFSGITLAEFKSSIPYLKQEGNVLVVGDVASHCAENDCSIFKYKIVSCRTFMRYFQPSALLSPKGLELKGQYEKILNRKDSVFVFGELNNYFFDLGVMEEQCILVY